MKLNKYLLATVVATALSSAAVQAADGTITFNGTVTDSACTAIASVTADTVATGTPISATLTLPPVTTTTLNAATGTYAGQTPFSIQLTGCEAATGLSNVRALFTTSNTPSGDAHVMANTAATTPATNVAVAIMQQNGTTQIDLNGGMGGTATDPGAALPVAGSPGPLNLHYKAAYKSLNQSVTAGNVTGVADFVISYF
ncbi:type 1 fimbrial protein [Budviciaceae bacterium BWR-B9]|uniref:Type 1 fimbrial protein n=1 Tax=Limnobaculum allomyrinae TaxID=2791986 RepID=A0ABS1ILI7_9GAMM|nr:MULTISPECIES: fimbrial protein [Limnobaculum]MBK5142613.1 type 1 fimbrial protein [Limnobaculum allomyrinae]MBV7690501.1 type 1 fimbrial protein [Limnobaculum sp. M2-1]